MASLSFLIPLSTLSGEHLVRDLVLVLLLEAGVMECWSIGVL
jgi:hypothetical protein